MFSFPPWLLVFPCPAFLQCQSTDNKYFVGTKDNEYFTSSPLVLGEHWLISKICYMYPNLTNWIWMWGIMSRSFICLLFIFQGGPKLESLCVERPSRVRLAIRLQFLSHPGFESIWTTWGEFAALAKLSYASNWPSRVSTLARKCWTFSNLWISLASTSAADGMSFRLWKKNGSDLREIVQFQPHLKIQRPEHDVCSQKPLISGSQWVAFV